MSRPIYEPDPETKIATNKFGVKDLRFRPLASRWYEPDCVSGVNCDGDEPTLTNGNFTQPSTQPFGQDIETFAYRFSKDGSLQTKGILDASGAASGDYAFTLPGVADPDNEVYSIPNSNPNAPTDQAFALRVTTTGDDAGVTPATGYVDSASGDVYVRWAQGSSLPYCYMKWIGSEAVSANTIFNPATPADYEESFIYDPGFLAGFDCDLTSGCLSWDNPGEYYVWATAEWNGTGSAGETLGIVLDKGSNCSFSTNRVSNSITADAVNQNMQIPVDRLFFDFFGNASMLARVYHTDAGGNDIGAVWIHAVQLNPNVDGAFDPP